MIQDIYGHVQTLSLLFVESFFRPILFLVFRKKLFNQKEISESLYQGLL